MLNNQNLVKGIAIVGIALFFGLQALNYSVGTFTRPGAGLFPFLVSGFLLLVGLAIIIRTRVLPVQRLQFHWRNVTLVTAAIVAFTIISQYVNALIGIIVMIFIASLASDDFSPIKTVKICVVLVIIAFALQKGLGFQLPLY